MKNSAIIRESSHEGASRMSGIIVWVSTCIYKLIIGPVWLSADFQVDWTVWKLLEQGPGVEVVQAVQADIVDWQ